MSAQKEKISNAKAYNNVSNDPIFRTRQSAHSKEDKYDPSKYSDVYNTLNEPPEEPILMSKSKEKKNSKKIILKKNSLPKDKPNPPRVTLNLKRKRPNRPKFYLRVRK